MSKKLDKNTPTQVVILNPYHSMGYLPTFKRCLNCGHDLVKTWEKYKECPHCQQKLLWSNQDRKVV